MWKLFYNSITDGYTVVCTFLAFLVPYTIYKLNKRLHKYGDPPWKKEGE